MDTLVETAPATSGSPSSGIMEQGPMYGRDPDGHLWEVVHTDAATTGDRPPRRGGTGRGPGSGFGAWSRRAGSRRQCVSGISCSAQISLPSAV